MLWDVKVLCYWFGGITDFSLELSITVIFRVMEGLCRRDGSRGWIKIKLFLLFDYYLIGVIQYKELS